MTSLCRAQVASIVEEYFVSGDIADVAESLEDLGVPVSYQRTLTCGMHSAQRAPLGLSARS